MINFSAKFLIFLIGMLVIFDAHSGVQGALFFLPNTYDAKLSKPTVYLFIKSLSYELFVIRM